MYYLVDIHLDRPELGEYRFETLHRLVKAKDKNSACDKAKAYLNNTWLVPNHLRNIGMTVKIECFDTID
jgi:hypothetical protein